MKKYLAVLLVLVVGLFMVTACNSASTTETGTDESSEHNMDMNFVAAGQWEYLGQNSNDRTFKITLNLEDNGEFELTVADEGEPEGSATQEDALIKGTYTSEDGTIDLMIKEVDGDTAILGADVKADSTVSQPYTVDDEDMPTTLTLTKASELIPTMPDELMFERVD